MSDTVIKVENLSKRYVIGHQRQERYSTLRDAIANGARSLKQRFFNPNQKLEDPAHEEFWALKDVSFEIKQGDRVGIIGRNGAGKSTLLKILSRITEPTSGRISIKGRVASLLEVGTGFHAELTGRENIFLNGAILGMSRAEINKKFDEIVDFAEVEKFLDTPVKHYSSGMYVRLAFAVAAHLEPEILIVDEVLAVGDAAFQKKCLGKMEDVAEKEGRTVLFVSHDMAAISSLCSNSILLVQGFLNVMEISEKVISLYMSFGNTISNSEVCLINHPNRALKHEQLITKIVTNLNEGNIAYYSQPLEIELYYNFYIPIITPQFVISIYTVSGIRVFSLISDYQPNDLPKSLQGSGKVSCNVPRLPLLPGAYFISLKLWQPGQKLDDIENVLSFQVEWLDRDSNQLKWDNSLGVVYVDANWQLDSYSGHDC